MNELSACPLCGHFPELKYVGDNKDLLVYQCAHCGYIAAKNHEAKYTKRGAMKIWNKATKKA